MTDTPLAFDTLKPASDQDDLLHLIYDTALDNSLWPDMILRVYEEFERIETGRTNAPEAFHDLQSHFVRGLQISERLVQLREVNDIHHRLLNGLSLRVWLFDAKGHLIHGEADPTALPGCTSPGEPAYTLPQALIDDYQRDQNLAISVPTDTGTTVMMLMGPQQVQHIGLPPRVHWAMFEMDQDAARIAKNIGQTYRLAPSRQRLLEAFIRHANLRAAADEASLSYETARIYLKDICASLGVSGQTELLRSVLLNPASTVPVAAPQRTQQDVQQIISRPDGSTLEFFRLGDDDAYPIIHFDALTGGALDILENPNRYLPVLRRLNARLIIPCRPGTFRSDFCAQSSARDYAREVKDICDHQGIERFALLAYSYGSVAALGTAYEIQDRVDRVVLASICYPDYIAPNWRSMDFFYQVSRVIGQRWPGLLRRVIPFLCKSILQNIDNFSDRAAARADCAHEEALLMTPAIRERSRAMLEARIAQGMDGLVQEYQIIAKQFDFDCADLNVPLYLFHGDCDRINPLGGAKALAQAAPQATLTQVPERGHAFIYAEWDWLLAAAAGAPYTIPPPTRRGILTKAV